MSIAFLELAYPPPGQVHRGQLQLVEVSRAGLEPSKGPKEPLLSLSPRWRMLMLEGDRGCRVSFLIIHDGSKESLVLKPSNTVGERALRHCGSSSLSLATTPGPKKLLKLPLMNRFLIT